MAQAIGVRKLLRQRHRLLAPHQPLGRRATIPQRPSAKAVAYHPRVLTIEERISAVLLGIVERHPLCKVCLCRGDRAQMQQDRSHGSMRCEEHPRVLSLLRQCQKLLAYGVRCLQLGSVVITTPQSTQYWEE